MGTVAGRCFPSEEMTRYTLATPTKSSSTERQPPTGQVPGGGKNPDVVSLSLVFDLMQCLTGDDMI